MLPDGESPQTGTCLAGLSVLLFAGILGVIALASFKFHLHAILAFWAAYVITRPQSRAL